MKAKVILILLSVLVVGNSAFAANEAKDMGTIICHQVLPEDSRVEPATVVLMQTAKYKYELHVFIQQKRGGIKTILRTMTNAYGEDVQVFFTSARREVTFGLYLDELDQSYLGSKKHGLDMVFDCTPPEDAASENELKG